MVGVRVVVCAVLSRALVTAEAADFLSAAQDIALGAQSATTLAQSALDSSLRPLGDPFQALQQPLQVLHSASVIQGLDALSPLNVLSSLSSREEGPAAAASAAATAAATTAASAPLSAIEKIVTIFTPTLGAQEARAFAERLVSGRPLSPSDSLKIVHAAAVASQVESSVAVSESQQESSAEGEGASAEGDGESSEEGGELTEGSEVQRWSMSAPLGPMQSVADMAYFLKWAVKNPAALLHWNVFAYEQCLSLIDDPDTCVNALKTEALAINNGGMNTPEFAEE